MDNIHLSPGPRLFTYTRNLVVIFAWQSVGIQAGRILCTESNAKNYLSSYHMGVINSESEFGCLFVPARGMSYERNGRDLLIGNNNWTVFKGVCLVIGSLSN